jgi:hypothetical protein
MEESTLKTGSHNTVCSTFRSLLVWCVQGQQILTQFSSNVKYFVGFFADVVTFVGVDKCFSLTWIRTLYLLPV